MKQLANKSLSFALCVALGLIATVNLKAQAPDTVSIQLNLSDSLGVPLDSSGVGINIRLYQGAALRLSQNFTVDVENGITNIALDATDFAFDREFDMAVFLGGVEITPRTTLRSVPYALGLRGLKVYPTTGAPNLIGGYSGNGFRANVVGATIGGGGSGSPSSSRNRVLDNYGTIGGGIGNEVGADTSSLGTALAAAILGGRANKALGLHAGVVSGQFNIAGGSQSFVGSGQGNDALASRAGIVGGASNVVRGLESFVGGGYQNEANGTRSFVGSGQQNIAESSYASVVGGRYNLASGTYSSVTGGRYNAARGTSSFAGGVSAKADHSLSFVWNGSSGIPGDSLHSTANSQFIVRANGGLHYWHEDSLVVTADERGLIPGADGAYNLGSQELMWDSLWAYYPPVFISDRNSKFDIAELDYGLEQALALKPVSYNYKRKPDGRRQMGLIAQETAEVIPEIVVEGAGTMGIQYSALIPLLISAIQDQQELINAQSARIEALEAKSLR